MNHSQQPMQTIRFYEQYEWSNARNAMKFWAVLGEDVIICFIDEAALVTFSSDDEEEKSAQAYFMENQERIHNIAKSLIIGECFNNEGNIIITSQNALVTCE